MVVRSAGSLTKGLSTGLATVSSPFAAFQAEEALSDDIVFAGLAVHLTLGIRAALVDRLLLSLHVWSLERNALLNLQADNS